MSYTNRNRTDVGRPPCYTLHRSHSFIVDSLDENLKVGLRKKSLTGDIPHRLLQQISDAGRVNIPVEHIPEEDAVARTPRTTYPELPDCSNFARNASANSSKSGVTKKTSPRRAPPGLNSDFVTNDWAADHDSNFRRQEYDYKQYEDQSKINNNSFDFKPITNYESRKHDMVSGYRDEEMDDVANHRQATQSKADKKLDNKLEIAHQDDFMKESYRLHRHLIIPDGNCLYRAVAQACLLDQNQHQVLRQLAIDHIREHKEEFKELVEGDIDVFLSAAQLKGEWAGYPEILALSRVLDVNINITTGGSRDNPKVQVMLHHFQTNNDSEQSSSTKHGSQTYTQRDSIWLSWLSSGHYDTFTNKRLENHAYDEWYASTQSRLESDAAIANKLYMDDVGKVQQLDRNGCEGEKRNTTPRPRDEYAQTSSTKDAGRYGNSAGGKTLDELNTNATAAEHVYPDSQHINFDDELAMALHNEEYDRLCADLERNRGFDYA